MPHGQKGNSSRRKFLTTTIGIGSGLAAYPAITRGDELTVPLHDEALDVDRYAEFTDAVALSLNCIIAESVDKNFPRPFEINRLSRDPKLREEIELLCLTPLIRPSMLEELSPLVAMTTPNTNLFGYRRCVHLELEAAALYLACAILIARRIEPARNLIAADRVFSYRFKPDGAAIFDTSYNYESFAGQTSAKLHPNDRLFMVSADISSFYPTINIDRLIAILQQNGVEPHLTDLLRNILSRWNTHGQTGIPVGPAASHLLAEAALLEVDRQLVKNNVDFVRYVDDYRLFAPDLTAARHQLGCLIEHLANEGLSLNNTKTSIEAVTRSEFEDYGRARRSARYWGELKPVSDGRFAEDTTKPQGDQGIGDSKTGSQNRSKKKDNNPPAPSTVPDIYGQSPFKKSQLSDTELALLRDVEPAAAFSRLLTYVEQNRSIPLGQFRSFVESSCYRGDYELLVNALDILNHCQHCIPYLIDVLIAEKERISYPLRTTSADWFAARLTSGQCESEFELMHVATLLGTDGYRRPKAISAYLKTDQHNQSPLVVRSCAEALRGLSAPEQENVLIELVPNSGVFVRRAILDCVWSNLRSTRRKSLVEAYEDDFERDPFLRSLLRDSATADTA